jgi:hypothetical protein
MAKQLAASRREACEQKAELTSRLQLLKAPPQWQREHEVAVVIEDAATGDCIDRYWKQAQVEAATKDWSKLQAQLAQDKGLPRCSECGQVRHDQMKEQQFWEQQLDECDNTGRIPPKQVRVKSTGQAQVQGEPRCASCGQLGHQRKTHHLCPLNPKRNAAAAKIQALWRDYRSRQARQVEATTQIQALWQDHCSRQARQVEAAMQIQALWRERSSRQARQAQLQAWIEQIEDGRHWRRRLYDYPRRDNRSRTMKDIWNTAMRREKHRHAHCADVWDQRETAQYWAGYYCTMIEKGPSAKRAQEAWEESDYWIKRAVHCGVEVQAYEQRRQHALRCAALLSEDRWRDVFRRVTGRLAYLHNADTVNLQKLWYASLFFVTL